MDEKPKSTRSRWRRSIVPLVEDVCARAVRQWQIGIQAAQAIADHPSTQRQQAPQLIRTEARADDDTEARSALSCVPPFAFDTRNADFLPQPVVERRSRERVLGRPGWADVLERER